MRNFNRNNLLNFFTFFILLLIIMFLYYLFKFKIWTYKSYSIIKDTDYIYQVIVPTIQKELFLDNNYLYFNNEKYTYEIINFDTVDKNIIFTLEFAKKLDSKNKIESITIQDTKKTLFSLIIDCWRDNEKIKK